MAYLDPADLKFVDAGMLRVAYHDLGSRNGSIAILLHGFPYDVQSYAEVSEALVAVGWRVIVPYLRGYGPTTFLSNTALRSGQQAVLAYDLRKLMNALDIDRAVLAGYDWGGRAACIVSALWPDRVQGLVTANGYNIQNIAASARPQSPDIEHRYWYQYYLHGERGRRGLERNRHEFCKLLWRLWSPNWGFTDEIYNRSACSFDNPDFVQVVVHSYRHRYRLVMGDPTVDAIEKRLAEQPTISVPTVSLDGGSDGVSPSRGGDAYARYFTGRFKHQVIPSIGHNVPQEAPAEFAAAILSRL